MADAWDDAMEVDGDEYYSTFSGSNTAFTSAQSQAPASYAAPPPVPSTHTNPSFTGRMGATDGTAQEARWRHQQLTAASERQERLNRFLASARPDLPHQQSAQASASPSLKRKMPTGESEEMEWSFSDDALTSTPKASKQPSLQPARSENSMASQRVFSPFSLRPQDRDSAFASNLSSAVYQHRQGGQGQPEFPQDLDQEQPRRILTIVTSLSTNLFYILGQILYFVTRRTLPGQTHIFAVSTSATGRKRRAVASEDLEVPVHRIPGAWPRGPPPRPRWPTRFGSFRSTAQRTGSRITHDYEPAFRTPARPVSTWERPRITAKLVAAPAVSPVAEASFEASTLVAALTPTQPAVVPAQPEHQQVVDTEELSDAVSIEPQEQVVDTKSDNAQADSSISPTHSSLQDEAALVTAPADAAREPQREQAADLELPDATAEPQEHVVDNASDGAQASGQDEASHALAAQRGTNTNADPGVAARWFQNATGFLGVRLSTAATWLPSTTPPALPSPAHVNSQQMTVPTSLTGNATPPAAPSALQPTADLPVRPTTIRRDEHDKRLEQSALNRRALELRRAEMLDRQRRGEQERQKRQAAAAAAAAGLRGWRQSEADRVKKMGREERRAYLDSFDPQKLGGALLAPAADDTALSSPASATNSSALPPPSSPADDATRDDSVEALVHKARATTIESPSQKQAREEMLLKKRRAEEAKEQAKLQARWAEEKAWAEVRILAREREEAAAAAKAKEVKEEEERVAAAAAAASTTTAGPVQEEQDQDIIAPVPTEWSARLDNIMATVTRADAPIAKCVGGYELSRRALGRILAPPAAAMDGWLDDDAVNAWFDALCLAKQERAGWKKGSAGAPPVAAYNSGWWKSQRDGGVAALRSWSRRKGIQGPRLLGADKIFFPLNTGVHWTLLVVSPRDRSIEYLDSLGGAGKDAFRVARAWLAMELGPDGYAPGEWSESRAKSQRQSNSSDCGVFVCFNALAAAKAVHYREVRPAKMQEARRMMAAVLVNGGFSGDFSL